MARDWRSCGLHPGLTGQPFRQVHVEALRTPTLRRRALTRAAEPVRLSLALVGFCGDECFFSEHFVSLSPVLTSGSTEVFLGFFYLLLLLKGLAVEHDFKKLLTKSIETCSF